jgi:hypothetical protein
MKPLSPARSVALTWLVIALSLVARDWWVRTSGPGPLPWKREKPPGRLRTQGADGPPAR